MGTRHLIKVIANGETKVAQYGQWDGYPSYTGAEIFKALKSHGVPRLAEGLTRCKFLSEKDLEKYDKNPDWIPPSLLRDTGCDIIHIIAMSDEGDEIELFDSSEFEKDGLFCEFSYTIDLDKGRFSCRIPESDTTVFDFKIYDIVDGTQEFVIAEEFA